MAEFKKICKALLLPHIAIAIVLVPIALFALVYSMTMLGTENVISYFAYGLSAYTLTVWCVRLPRVIKYFKTFKRENKYAQRWSGDIRLRMKVTLYASFLWNTAYAVFQLGLGIWHSSFWFYSLAVYYILLAVMRFTLVSYTRKNQPCERMYAEYARYRACGWVLLFMNLALAVMIFFMVYWGRTFVHHEITTIAMAAYTFVSFSTSVIGILKYKKLGSPVFSAKCAISFAAACVSMLTLTSTMLTTFGEGNSPAFRRIMLSLAGGGVTAAIVSIAIYMIVQGTKKRKILKVEIQNGK